MKFILNTSIDPHFCFFSNEENKIVDLCTWENRRLDGQEVFKFLEKHSDLREKIDFVGGVSGPGGFSSLRVGAAIINAIAAAQNIKTRAVRADQWIAALLEKSGENIPFVLNSFGAGVFLQKGDQLERVLLDEMVSRFGDKSVYTDLLPEEKKIQFSNSFKIELSLIAEDSLNILVQLLEKEPGTDLFLPKYEVNAV